MRGRPRTTWRRTFKKECNKEHVCRLDKLEYVQNSSKKNRGGWKDNVTALCTFWQRAMMMNEKIHSNDWKMIDACHQGLLRKQ